VARPRLKKRLKPRSADTARSRSVGPRLARDTGDIAKMARKYKVSIDTPDGSGTCFQVTVHRERGKKPLVARFGGYHSHASAVVNERFG
jgi:hypothetical protein